MTLDQINQFKAKCQTDMPVVELMKIRADPDSLMGLERDQRLALMGFDWHEIEELTGYKRKEPVQFDPDALVEVVVSAHDLPDKAREVNARIEAEWRAEHDRIVETGIALGWIEEEIHTEPML